MARGRIELPTRGFSVLPAVFSIPEHQPTSHSKRYYIGTSAAAVGGRCLGSRCTCLMVRGTTGGQSISSRAGSRGARSFLAQLGHECVSEACDARAHVGEGGGVFRVEGRARLGPQVGEVLDRGRCRRAEIQHVRLLDGRRDWARRVRRRRDCPLEPLLHGLAHLHRHQGSVSWSGISRRRI